MPVGVDEYLRRSIRHFKSGLAAHKLRFARVRACRNQLKAIVEQAGKYDIDLSEIGLADWSGLPELATTAKDRQGGGEGVAGRQAGLNLNQSIPDSNNSQSVLEGSQVSQYAGSSLPMPDYSAILNVAVAEQPVASGELKAALEWPVEAGVRIVGGCPNPRLLRGVVEDGRGCVVWSKGLERVRAGCVVGCVKVKDGEYRRK